MKNLLKKLSRADRNDRREALEQEAAAAIEQAGGHVPPEAFAQAWGAQASAPSAPPVSATGQGAGPSTPVPGRRPTVQERVAARQLQS